LVSLDTLHCYGNFDTKITNIGVALGNKGRLKIIEGPEKKNKTLGSGYQLNVPWVNSISNVGQCGLITEKPSIKISK